MCSPSITAKRPNSWRSAGVGAVGRGALVESAAARLDLPKAMRAACSAAPPAAAFAFALAQRAAALRAAAVGQHRSLRSACRSPRSAIAWARRRSRCRGLRCRRPAGVGNRAQHGVRAPFGARRQRHRVGGIGSVGRGQRHRRRRPLRRARPAASGGWPARRARPAAMARITVAPPVTMSPPAKTPAGWWPGSALVGGDEAHAHPASARRGAADDRVGLRAQRIDHRVVAGPLDELVERQRLAAARASGSPSIIFCAFRAAHVALCRRAGSPPARAEENSMPSPRRMAQLLHARRRLGLVRR